MIKALGLMALALTASAVAQAGDVKVTWTQDTTVCADGSPMVGNCPVVGFQMFEGGSLTTLQFKENITVAAQRERTYQYAPGTSRCYSMKSFTGTLATPVLSEESQKTCVTVPFIPPKAPSITVEARITITATLQGTPESVK